MRKMAGNMGKTKEDKVQEIKDAAFELVKRASKGEVIRQESERLMAEYAEVLSEFRKGSRVWVLDGWSILEALVTEVVVDSRGGFYYRLVYEETSRIIGTLPEREVFHTREELCKGLQAVMDGPSNFGDGDSL